MSSRGTDDAMLTGDLLAASYCCSIHRRSRPAAVFNKLQVDELVSVLETVRQRAIA